MLNSTVVGTILSATVLILSAIIARIACNAIGADVTINSIKSVPLFIALYMLAVMVLASIAATIFEDIYNK